MRRTRRDLGRHAIALLGAAVLAPLAMAAETTVQNDSLADGATGAVQAGFIAGEEGAAWLQMPCDGNIVAVQIGWYDNNSGSSGDQSIEDWIHIYDGGNASSYPFPGATLQDLEAPLMTEGFLNEFRFVDENNTIPLNVPVTTGQWIVVSLEFFNTPNILFGPSLITDINGCQNGRNAIACLSGCAPWTNPCTLGISGDFMIRAVVDCSGPTSGACCFNDGSCMDPLTAASCAGMGGVYQGDFTECITTSCPIPTGGCCVDGTCFPNQTQNDCEVVNGGTWLGPNTDCSGPSPCQGACCFSDPDGCSVLSEANCGAAGGVFAGLGTDCADLDINGIADVCQDPEGSCCFGLTCVELTEADCATSAGVYLGDDTNCTDDPCPDPFGACCLANGACISEVQADCELIPGASWAGADTICPGACVNCPADCDDGSLSGTPDGQVNVSDMLGVLAGWGQSLCDVDDGSGTGTPDGQVNVSDLLYVLAEWGPCL